MWLRRPIMPNWLIVLCAVFASQAAWRSPSATGAPPNIIFILTDDQRWDTLLPEAPDYMPLDLMPNTRRELMDKGVVFTEAFVTSPLCCPARASILSGGFYAQNTGVLQNAWPNGGVLRFHDRQSLATLLQEKGYRTSLIGKYMNAYALAEGVDATGQPIPPRRYIPPGWSAWMGMWAMNYTDATGGYRFAVGASTPGDPARGLSITEDVRLPSDIADLSAFLQTQESRGFPHALGEYITGLLTKRGDINHDGDRDLADFVTLHNCLATVGAGQSPTCLTSDTNGDDSVDLRDFAAFQRNFGAWPYLTDFQREASLAFLTDEQIAAQPFFLMITPYAPHYPAIPAREDADLFQGFEYRSRGWGEQDLSDKPSHIRDYVHDDFAALFDRTRPFFADGRSPDDYFADQLRCLQSVDRLVRDVVAAIDGNAQLRDNTVIIFASDNGELWGEHKQFYKSRPFEEAIRVPLLVRAPGVAPTVIDQLVAVTLDVPATILHLAGYSEEEIAAAPLSEGRSLMPLLPPNGGGTWRDHLLFELWRRLKPSLLPTWTAMRTDRWKYVRYDYFDGTALAEQLYDLLSDPFELQDVHSRAEYQAVKTELKDLLLRERGLSLTGQTHPWGSLPAGTVGVPYRYELGFEGGTGTVTFALFDSNEPLSGLPDGVTLSADGVIVGTPQAAGNFEFNVKVQDETVSPQNAGPQWSVVRLLLKIR